MDDVMAGVSGNIRGEKDIGFWFKIKTFFKYGITHWSFYKQEFSKIITTFQAMIIRQKKKNYLSRFQILRDI